MAQVVEGLYTFLKSFFDWKKQNHPKSIRLSYSSLIHFSTLSCTACNASLSIREASMRIFPRASRAVRFFQFKRKTRHCWLTSRSTLSTIFRRALLFRQKHSAGPSLEALANLLLRWTSPNSSELHTNKCARPKLFSLSSIDFELAADY